MKKLMRNLAVAVVAACVAALAIAPGAALAASITLKSGSSSPVTVYTGESYNLKVTGTTTVKWTSSNRKVATVSMVSGKLKPLAPGKAIITATSTKTGKKVASKMLTVLQRAKSITTSTSELFLGQVGDTARITAELSPSTSTDVVRFESSDKTVAIVGAASGKVTAKAEGTCTISVISKATKMTSDSSKSNVVRKVKVQVGPQLTSAEYDGVRIFATLKGAPRDLKTVDFAAINDTTKVKSPIKSVEQDGDQVILELYARLGDDNPYTLTYRNTTSTGFRGTEPVIDSVKLTPDTVVAGVETPVNVQLVTNKGSVIEWSDLSGRGLNYFYDVILKLASGDGYCGANSTLCLWEPGKTATVEIVKHTYTYDEEGKEIGVFSWEATVTAREPQEGEATPTYDARSVSYNYSGNVGGTISITLSDNVPPGFTAEDFTVKLKPSGTSSGRAEYVPDAASASGKSITLTISSSDLTNGRTYEVYCTKAPIAKKLGEFTVVKYSYTPSVPDTPTEPPTEGPSGGNEDGASGGGSGEL
ncbi:MAG: Ig-like domain-containing protein [Coriobacteriales bacterium]|nr:Ig-like domain-containing protein [Coriobacteriales bacterium]